MDKITEDTTLAEILKYEKAIEILTKYRLPCLRCPMAKHEISRLKIGQVANMYEIDGKGLLKELNENL